MGTSPDENVGTEAGVGASGSPDALGAAAEGPAAAAEVVQPDPSAEPPFTHTRASGLWAAVVVALVVLLALLVFILENGRHVDVRFFGAHGHLPLGVALLLAAVFGGLAVVLAGTARILQLRRRARRHRPPGAGPRRGRRSRSRTAS